MYIRSHWTKSSVIKGQDKDHYMSYYFEFPLMIQHQILAFLIIYKLYKMALIKLALFHIGSVNMGILYVPRLKPKPLGKLSRIIM